MADFDDTNRGALFENDKQDNPNRPDYKGSLNVDGKEYWISMWEKTSKKGLAYYSLAVEPKEDGGSRGKNSEAWKQVQQKFGKKDAEDRNDDSAKDHMKVKDDYDEPIDINDIPFN